MCKCVIGEYKQLLGIRNNFLTPLYLAAVNKKKDAFLWLSMTTAKPTLVWLLFMVPLKEITLLGVPTFLHACGGYKLDIYNWFNLSLTVSYA